uniref:Uncharacterized protein n=1 Tax=Meloidogyne enterolobii TaxID=390850 RepID=A0A6V7VVZ8_MELEN|nr:unnamed protein product [Meloidogyne enterolobii]
MHQSIPLIFILYIFLLRFSNYNADETKRLEKSLTLSDWMENYPEQQETGNTGVSNINVPIKDDHDKVVTTFIHKYSCISILKHLVFGRELISRVFFTATLLEYIFRHFCIPI